MDANQKFMVKDTGSLAELNMAELFMILLHNFAKILALALAGGIVAMLITVTMIKPIYRSSFTAFVNNRNTTDETQSLGSGDITAARSLTYTYAAIMTSRPVIEDAMRRTDMISKYTFDEVKASIATNIEENTQLVILNVAMHSAEDAYKLATAIADISPEYVANIVEGSSMKVVTNPVLPTRQYSPSIKLNIMAGMMIGALIMIAYVTIRTLTDNHIKGEQELEERFGISVIGTIPKIDGAVTGKYGGAYGSKSSSKRGE